jgi:hypothetical protein
MRTWGFLSHQLFWKRDVTAALWTIRFRIGHKIKISLFLLVQSQLPYCSIQIAGKFANDF